MSCNICKLVLKDPVLLPCLSAICNGHLTDGTAKNGSIRCTKCDKDFEVSESGFPIHELTKNIVEKEFYLSEDEKKIKLAVEELIQTLEEIQFDLKQKHSELIRKSADHFSEIRRLIDVQREELKAKIDEIALKLIDETNEKEKAYNSKIEESLLNATRIDIEQSRYKVANEFRNPMLLVEEAKRMQNEQQQKVNEFQARKKEIESLFDEKELLVFTPNLIFRDESFGLLALKGV